MVKYGGHGLLGKHKDTQQVPNNTKRAGQYSCHTRTPEQDTLERKGKSHSIKILVDSLTFMKGRSY